MEREITRYYKRIYSGGMRLPARIINECFFIILIATAAYLWFLGSVENRSVCAILAIIIGLLFIVLRLLYRKIRFDDFVERHKEEISNEIRAIKLLKISAKEIKKLLLSEGIKTCAIIQSMLPCDGDTLLHIYKNAVSSKKEKLEIFSVNGFSSEANELAKRLDDIEIVLLSKNVVTEKIPVSDEEINAAIIKKISTGRKKFSLFGRQRIKPFFLFGAALIILSFFTRYGFYYKLLGGLCFAISMYNIRKKDK